jgi:2-polyprenyl-3-methyl-5-hydroxy-6-metoxy-1,4-benzoquinol methylase
MMENSVFQMGAMPAQSYRGILMRANPKLHQEAFAELSKHIPKHAKIVDVGAGQGAFSLRLGDNGYDVLAIDNNPSDFKATDVPFNEVDFNDPKQIMDFRTKNANSFDVAIGMEVIEHVHNPWDYVALLSSLVKKGGHILITTPNIESSMSKLYFVFTGKHLHFDEHDLEESGHINPVTLFEMETIAKSMNMEIVISKDICQMAKFTISKKIFTLFISTLNTLFGWTFGKRRNGDILLVLLKKH